MFRLLSKTWQLNALLLLCCLIFSGIAFTLYSAFIIQKVALHDVYYNSRLYTSTYHFLLVSLFSLGFFLLPFLNIFSRSFNHRRLLTICLAVQFISILILYYHFNFMSLLFSVVSMSLTNIIFVLIILNLWAITPAKYRFFVISISYAIKTAILTAFFNATYSYHQTIDNPYFLLVCTIFIIISATSLLFCSLNIQKKVAYHSYTDHLFINIFYLMRHSRVFFKTTAIAIIITVVSIYLDKIKFQALVHYSDYLTPSLFLKTAPINLLLAAIICYIASIKRLKTQLASLLIVIFCVSSISLLTMLYLSSNISINLFFSSLFITDQAIGFLAYAFIIGICIDKLLNEFKRSQVFAFSVFYVLTGVMVWTILQILNAVF
ncbi:MULTISPECIES: hypothetical protein [Cysteiniphilum]|uniref:Uncharacterized protein n=1 Tax=Cysteiniphilum litorale TaxID=2056700 RepID=A0A8J2Z3W3_9GAMM|nr:MULTISPECIES: hypothetical protein [Cysteiniphilum]GGF96392.1 hypothetical protein GCM10010995_12030 [Cysteiniphilum litorale]